MTDDIKLKEVKNKPKVFYEKQTFIFVKTVKLNGSYALFNGVIKEQSASFFIMIDYKTGNDVPIFFSELIKDGSVFEPSRNTDYFCEGGKIGKNN